MPPKKTTAAKSSVTSRKKQLNAASAKKNNEVTKDSITTSTQSQDNPTAFDTAKKILANNLLFDEDFVQQQRKNLAVLLETEKTSSNFHEMPEENLKVAVVGAFSCGKSAFITRG